MNPPSFTISLTPHRRERGRELEVGEEESLSEGASFWQIEHDLQPIYENFNILSYFSPSVGIQLHDVKQGQYNGKLINIYQFSFGNTDRKFYLCQLSKQPYQPIYLAPGKEKLKIRYTVANKFNWPQQNANQQFFKIKKMEEINLITVTFQVIENIEPEGVKQKHIVINIDDQGGWILNNLYPIHHDNRSKFGRISEKRRPTRRRNNFPSQKDLVDKLIQLPARLMLPQFSTDLEYFYIEPKSQRQKVIGKKHIALALQGGGCKGVTYIGAYKAILDNLKDQNENIAITSVIGSSAGGIVGMPISCLIEPQDVIELCQKFLSKVTDDKTYPEKTEKTVAMVDRCFGVLEQVLRDFNIFDDQLIEICKNFLHDQEFMGYISELLKEGSGLSENKGFLGLFQYSNKEKNYCGLLNAKLMNGEKIKDIVRASLLLMDKHKKFDKNMQRYFAQLKNKEERDDWVNKITMKQLYKITGIQFTCTSVDITNHMLRFFNHKTTPGLPVVNAVQMTGAFPVAFQPTYWKKQWGKYYIHYENMRREVDLEGCKFTDGGMLANFPIDCIDNDEMRPMYFSHVKDENTKIFGIGLRQCKSPQRQKKQVPNPLTICKILRIAGIKNIPSLTKQYIQGRFPIGKILGLFNKSQVVEKDISDTVLLERLRQIPLFDFGFNLLMTYSSTKDKLALESFIHQAYQIQPGNSVMGFIQDRDGAYSQVQNDLNQLRDRVGKIIKDARTHNQFETMIENLKYIANQPIPTTQDEILKVQSSLDIILSKLMFNFLHAFTDPETRSLLYELVQKSYKNVRKELNNDQLSPIEKLNKIIEHKSKMEIHNRDQYKKLQKSDNRAKFYFDRIFFELENMKYCKLFVLCNIQKDFQVIKKVTEEAVRVISQIFDRNSTTQLGMKIRQKSRQNPGIFVPMEYLKFERNNQRQKFEKVLNRLSYPNQKKYNKLREDLESMSRILERKVQYNNKFIKIFSSDPYSQTQMQNLIKTTQQIPELRDHSSSLKELMQNVGDNNVVKQITYHIKQIEANLNKLIQKQVFGSDEIVHDLIDVQSCQLTCRIQDIDGLNKTISSLKSCVQLVIAYETHYKRQHLNSYIKRSVDTAVSKFKGAPEGFHIVMQSAHLSEIYLLNIFDIMRGYNVQMKSRTANQSSNSYNLPVTSITTSNIHSIAALLYASDLSFAKINKYCLEIKELNFESDRNFVERAQKQLKSGQWAKKLPILLRDISTFYMQQAQTRNVFVETQRKLNSMKQWDQFKDEMRDIEQNAENYRQKIDELIEQSLNCVMDQIYKTDKAENISDRLDAVANSLALKYRNKSYHQQADVEPFMQLVQQVSSKYVELLKITVQTSPYIAEQLIANISKNQRKDAWKGIILGEIHTSFKIKRIVQQIMQEMKLTKDTTLQQFYRASRKKITLNFSVITTENNCIDIYNHHTRPYMPVWAAVVASSSLIQFFKPVSDRKQWGYQLLEDNQERKATQYFKQKSFTHHLYSADSLRKLPIDLLKNGKIANKVYNRKQKKEAFLIFDFFINIDYAKVLKKCQKQRGYETFLKIENTNFRDIVKMSRLEIKGNHFQNAPFFAENSKRMGLYIDSHDKLIASLYQKELIMIPIRLGTIDFHLMCVPGQDKLSKISNDAIMQSYFVMSEKIRNYKALETQKDRPNKILYFRVESKNSSQERKEDFKLAIRFLTRLVPNKAFKQDYKLAYKEKVDDAYQNVEDQFILLQNVGVLYLKISYVELRSNESQNPEKSSVSMRLRTKFFELDIRKFNQIIASNRPFGYVYCLQYTKSTLQQLVPQNGFDGSYENDYILKEEPVPISMPYRQYEESMRDSCQNLVKWRMIEDSPKQNHKLQQSNKSFEIAYLTIPVHLENDLEVLKYEKPMCDKYHPLQLKSSQKDVMLFKNPFIKARAGVPFYQCPTCLTKKQPKSQYTIHQKYQIKLESDR